MAGPACNIYVSIGMFLNSMVENSLFVKDKSLPHPYIDKAMPVWMFRKRTHNTKIGTIWTSWIWHFFLAWERRNPLKLILVSNLRAVALGKQVWLQMHCQFLKNEIAKISPTDFLVKSGFMHLVPRLWICGLILVDPNEPRGFIMAKMMTEFKI